MIIDRLTKICLEHSLTGDVVLTKLAREYKKHYITIKKRVSYLQQIGAIDSRYMITEKGLQLLELIRAIERLEKNE